MKKYVVAFSFMMIAQGMLASEFALYVATMQLAQDLSDLNLTSDESAKAESVFVAQKESLAFKTVEAKVDEIFSSLKDCVTQDDKAGAQALMQDLQEDRAVRLSVVTIVKHFIDEYENCIKDIANTVSSCDKIHHSVFLLHGLAALSQIGPKVLEIESMINSVQNTGNTRDLLDGCPVCD